MNSQSDTTPLTSNIAELREEQKDWLLENPQKRHPLVGSIIGADGTKKHLWRPVLINHVALTNDGDIFYGYLTMVGKPTPANRRHAVEITGATPASYIGEHVLARVQYSLIMGEDTLGETFKLWGAVDNITLNKIKKHWNKAGQYKEPHTPEAVRPTIAQLSGIGDTPKS